MQFQPRNPDFEARVRASFSTQKAMNTLGGTIACIEPGKVVLAMDFNPDFTQQHGFLHAGTITTMLDSAAGYAAFSLMSADMEVLTVEMKTSLIAPGQGEHFRFEGVVLKAGRTITFCQSDAYALTRGIEKRIASMSATMISTIL